MQSSIVPVPVFPSIADVLVVDSFYNFPPSYRWALSRTIKGSEGREDTTEMLIQGNASFSKEQWDAWTTQSDESYPLQVAATNLGVTLK